MMCGGWPRVRRGGGKGMSGRFAGCGRGWMGSGFWCRRGGWSGRMRGGWGSGLGIFWGFV